MTKWPYIFFIKPAKPGAAVSVPGAAGREGAAAGRRVAAGGKERAG